MTDRFKIFSTRIWPLDDESVNILRTAFSPAQAPKKSLILKEGDMANELYFLEQGIWRTYYIKDGEEITYGFLFAPTLFSDVVSRFDKQPTTLYVQALEDSVYHVANIKEIDALAERNIKLSGFFMRMFEYLYIMGYKRQLSLICDTAEERYLKLFKERPKVMSEVPMHYIASYLGIRKETLSRIRKKIMNVEYSQRKIESYPQKNTKGKC